MLGQANWSEVARWGVYVIIPAMCLLGVLIVHAWAWGRYVSKRQSERAKTEQKTAKDDRDARDAKKELAKPGASLSSGPWNKTKPLK